MNIDSTIIRLLEQKSQLDLSIGRNCEPLARFISAETSYSISKNTLKRVFGFINDGHEPMAYTLNAIARYLGFMTWEELVKVTGNSNCSWGEPLCQICDGVLDVGSVVQVKYQPEAKIFITYQGQDRYLVTESHNCQLAEGDELSIRCLTDGFPLYAAQVVRDGKPLGCFTAGRETGVKIKID